MNASISMSDLKGLSFGSKAFKHSALGMAIEESTTKFVQDIEKNKGNIQPASSGVITGKVLKVLGNKLIVNVGSNDGLKEKQIGKLIQVVEVEGLDEPVSVPLGKVQVLSVNDNAAVLVVIEKEEEPQKGYRTAAGKPASFRGGGMKAAARFFFGKSCCLSSVTSII